MTGRPSKYTPEIATSIIEQLSEGTPLRVICRQDNMPAWRTVYDWLDRDAELSAHIARARELGFDAIAEECLDIADDSSRDYRDTDKGPVYDAEHVQRSKLRVETRLKLLASWASSKYGSKQQVTATINDYSGMTSDERRRKLAELQQQLTATERS